jgi:hypothetical protein
MKAEDVRVGHLILTMYHPRTWLRVTEKWTHRQICQRDPCIVIDTARTRTSYCPGEMVPCKVKP